MVSNFVMIMYANIDTQINYKVRHLPRQKLTLIEYVWIDPVWSGSLLLVNILS